jgi:hypothetical protein
MPLSVYFWAFRFDVRAGFAFVVRVLAVGVFFLAFFFFFTRSGSRWLPVSRFHSSKVSGEISPLTSNSANFRRCA